MSNVLVPLLGTPVAEIDSKVQSGTSSKVPKDVEGEALRDSIAGLLAKPEYTDVTFSFSEQKDKKVQAHRSILASRSSIFLALFQSAPSKKDFEIADTKLEVFQALISCIYGSRSAVDTKILSELATAATKYGVSLQGKFSASLNSSNVLAMLAIDRASALSYIDQHAADTLKSTEFLSLSPESLSAIISRDEFPVSEADLFAALLKWGSARAKTLSSSDKEFAAKSDKDKVQAALKDVIVHVRFPLMSLQQFTVDVSSTGALSNERQLALFQHLSLAATSASTEWGCTVCTFKNKPTSPKCEACGAAKSAAASATTGASGSKVALSSLSVKCAKNHPMALYHNKIPKAYGQASEFDCDACGLKNQPFLNGDAFHCEKCDDYDVCKGCAYRLGKIVCQTCTSENNQKNTKCDTCQSPLSKELHDSGSSGKGKGTSSSSEQKVDDKFPWVLRPRAGLGYRFLVYAAAKKESELVALTNMVMAAGAIQGLSASLIKVESKDAAKVTLTLAELSQYDAVVTWVSASSAKLGKAGDNLLAYYKAGGALVVLPTPYLPSELAKYLNVTSSAVSTSVQVCTGAVYAGPSSTSYSALQNHPLFYSVRSMTVASDKKAAIANLTIGSKANGYGIFTLGTASTRMVIDAFPPGKEEKGCGSLLVANVHPDITAWPTGFDGHHLVFNTLRMAARRARRGRANTLSSCFAWPTIPSNLASALLSSPSGISTGQPRPVTPVTHPRAMVDLSVSSSSMSEMALEQR